MAKYIYPPPQQHYEKFLHALYVEHEKVQLRHLESKILKLMRERKDHKAYYYLPVSAKNVRISREQLKDLEQVIGDD